MKGALCGLRDFEGMVTKGQGRFQGTWPGEPPMGDMATTTKPLLSHFAAIAEHHVVEVVVTLKETPDKSERGCRCRVRIYRHGPWAVELGVRPRSEIHCAIQITLVTFRRRASRPAADCTDRKAYADSVCCWLMEQVDQEQQDTQRQGIEAKRGAALGVETVIKAAFDQRPNAPKRSPRPYCFGSQQAKREHYEMTPLVYQAHEVASDAYRAGDRTVNFPIGTYPPPIMSAAA